MTRRASRTALQKLGTLERHNRICHICGEPILDGEPFEEEHILALELGGKDDDSNRAPAHVPCHKPKTADDLKRIAKAKRVKAKHHRLKDDRRAIVPGSRASRFMRKADGTTILRDQDPHGKGKMR